MKGATKQTLLSALLVATIAPLSARLVAMRFMILTVLHGPTLGGLIARAILVGPKRQFALPIAALVGAQSCFVGFFAAPRPFTLDSRVLVLRFFSRSFS